MHHITGPPPTLPSSLSGREPGKPCSQQHAKPIWSRAYLPPWGGERRSGKDGHRFCQLGRTWRIEQCLWPWGSLAAPGAELQLGVSPAPRSPNQRGESTWHDGPLGQPGFASPASASGGGSAGKAVCLCLCCADHCSSVVIWAPSDAGVCQERASRCPGITGLGVISALLLLTFNRKKYLSQENKKSSISLSF